MINTVTLLDEITEAYPSLQYVTTKKGAIYFVGKDVEIAKGKAGDHFYRSFQTFCKRNKEKASSYNPQPQLLILEKETLQNFKNQYQQQIGYSLGCINRLIVINITAAHFYLELTAKEPQKKPILQSKKKSQQQTVIPSSSSSLLPSNIPIVREITEAVITKELSNLSSYTPNPYRREMTVINRLNDQLVSTRRFDLYRRLDNCVEVIEVKKNPLSPEDVAITLGDKGYLHLLPPDESTQFYFVAPYILPSAARLLEHTGDHIQFISLSDLVIKLLKEILDDLPSKGKWYIKEIIKDCLLINQTLLS